MGSILDALQFLIATTGRIMVRKYVALATVDPSMVAFHLGNDRQGRPNVQMSYDGRELAFVTPPTVTWWPRVAGDGNYGTMWGPQDPMKAKFTLDLTDSPISGVDEVPFKDLETKLNAVDDALLDFVVLNQQKILNRRNLNREEVKMLQIRSVRPKYDKLSGGLSGHTVNLSASKYAWDGVGGKVERKITVCDHKGTALKIGTVCPGDVIAATTYANQVYTGVGGDKFGIHWSFEDVSVVCQRMHLETKTEVNAFGTDPHSFARDYVSSDAHLDVQFGEEP
jgi:hypothetical protein